MNILDLGHVLNCEDCRRLLPAFINRALDAANRGRIQGHLCGCADCERLLWEHLARRAYRGELTPRPVMAAAAAATAVVSGQPAVKGWLWEAVKGWASEPPERVHQAAAHALAVLDAAAENARDRWDDLDRLRQALQDPAQLLKDLQRRLERAIFFWQWQPLSAFAGVLGEAALGAGHLGANSIEILHLDARGQPTGERTLLDTDPGSADVEQVPILTAQGQFHLAVTSDDARLTGQRLVCSLHLIEGEVIRFEANLQSTGDGTRWRAKFLAEDLPRPDRDVMIPWDSVTLIAVPTRPLS